MRHSRYAGPQIHRRSHATRHTPTEEETRAAAAWKAQFAYNLEHIDELRAAARGRKRIVVDEMAAVMRQKLAASGHVVEPWQAQDMSTEPWRAEIEAGRPSGTTNPYLDIPSQGITMDGGMKHYKSLDPTTQSMQDALDTKASAGGSLFRLACGVLSSCHYPECPQGHALVKLKEGLLWYEGHVHSRRCNTCGEDIPRDTPRWRCDQPCKFYLCVPCYKDLVRNMLLDTSSRPSKVPLQAALTVAAAAGLADTSEFNSAAQSLVQLYCENVLQAAAAYNPIRAKQAINDAMEALQGGVLPLSAEFVSRLNDALNEAPNGLVEALMLAVKQRDDFFIRRLFHFENSTSDFGLETTISGLADMAASACKAAYPMEAKLPNFMNFTAPLR